jgi:signal transduction histidine kinase
MPFVFLGSLFAVMAVGIALLARHILRTLNRFIGYTERIASGDLTPVLPARRFRDEFSTLAVYINRMVRALDRQHRILVESHKLRAMGNLVAGVAHELNNPMNNILLTASVLEEDWETLEPEDRIEMLEDLVGEAERTRKIVANLLDFARQSEAKIEPLDIVKTLEECAQLVGNQIRLKKVRLNLLVPEELPVVHGDRQLLSQVFTNLMINALDALPEGGEIHISFTARRREGFVAVDVTDNGPGMPEEVREKVFDPFFTTKPKGTGLGLSVSQGIIHKLGGHLLVQSEEGKGTTFTVLLPVTTIPSDLGTRAATPDAGGTDEG